VKCGGRAATPPPVWLFTPASARPGAEPLARQADLQSPEPHVGGVCRLTSHEAEPGRTATQLGRAAGRAGGGVST